MANKKYKILMVEDEPDLAEIYTLELEMAGFEVALAKDGALALEKLKTDTPDFILLDLLMPEIDGYEFLTKMKNHPKRKKLLIYAWSNLTQKNHIAKANDVGADGFLIKSDFTPRKLADKIKEILKIK